jgi:poly(A) polymerase
MIVASPTPEHPITLPPELIDSDAFAVCNQLQENGFIAYLVGGCVRDILLGRTPKDFDVGTSATPKEVRRSFRNCRIIGRRFRLAHVHYGSKIIEVATFRGGDENDDEDGAGDNDNDDHLIIRANNFGTPEQDALSRDFTVNALFYDPVAQKLIDNVNGYKDVEAGIIRTIGNSVLRFQEDPVRILRGLKFAARLRFEIHPETREAMSEVAQDISRCPIPRVTEELYRITESIEVERAMRLMHDTGVLPVVFPEIAEHVLTHGKDYFAFLAAADYLALAHGGLPRNFVMSVLYYPLALQVIEESGATHGAAWGKVAQEWFRPIGVRMHVAIKHRIRLGAIMALLGRFLNHDPHRRRFRISATERRALPQALAILRLRQRTKGDCAAAYEDWREFAISEGIPWVPTAEGIHEADGERERPRRRRRPRRRSRNRDEG